MGPAQSRAGLRHLMLCEGDVGLAHPVRRHGLIVKFGRNDARLAQLLGAIEIQLRLLGLRISEAQSGFSRIDLGEHLIDGLLGARELRLGLIDADLEIAGIEGHQQIAALDRPVVLDIDRRHGSGDAGRDQRDGSIDIGVIGRDVGREIVVVANCGKDAERWPPRSRWPTVPGAAREISYFIRHARRRDQSRRWRPYPCL